ncbi:hypothetical protein LP43_1580 [Methylophaga thiooxydans]|uniref:DUF2878 domain-containing protein n=1 Tax=Methylophaga thiooxydans TaxID=392484 RepID=A0A0A0BIZ0_9GAMM|nr:DUF2878 domain-containing protein [Methylophaga thiooxydans]KGM07079.1 hypothetical protein LP43_1580 [Methylophaga thiooxydans]
MANILNFLAFQLVWFITVLTAAKGSSLYALAAVIVFAIVQLIFSHCRWADAKLLMSGLVVGMLLDTVWLHLGWIAYAADPQTGLPPIWIGALWLNFMLTLNHSLNWLKKRYGLIVMCTLVAAPVSYYAGSKLGAVFLLEFVPALVALALSWSVVVPMFMAFAERWQQADKETIYAHY